MEHIEILLINYFSVIFLTIALSIFISKPEKIKESFTMWFLLAQISLSLLLYKVIQIYDGFHIIYIADLIFIAILSLSTFTIRTKKKNKIESLAATIPSLHKLSTEEFSSYLTTLFKAYGFQSVRQVKIQNDDHNNTYDHFLLARHEGILVEIRVINKIKKLSEEHINNVASNFRDSTSQATSWLLATSAKTDANTNIYVQNSGVDIKIFDFNIISNLVYGLAPDYKPSSSFIKNNFIRLIDQLLRLLTTTRNRLVSDSELLIGSIELKSPQKLLNNALGDTQDNQPSTLELFEENGIESTTEATALTKSKRKSKNKKQITQITNQGDLNLPSSEEQNTNIEVASLENEQKADAINDLEQNTNQPNVLIENLEVDKDLNNENITIENINNENDPLDNETPVQEDTDLLPTVIIDEPFTPDDTFIVEDEFDPLNNFSSLSETTHIQTDVDSMDDFPMENNCETPSTRIMVSSDDLFDEFQSVENIELKPSASLEPFCLNQEIDLSIDLSDIGAAITDPPTNYQVEKKE
jgi:hypothetical protein